MADRICDLTATRCTGIQRLCAEFDDLPDPQTIYRWLNSFPSFREEYARAKDSQMQVLADEIVDLADQDRICEKVTIKADGSRETVTLDQVDRTKLQIDSRKWLLSKLAPRKYGDKVQQEVSGPDGAPLPAIMVQFVKTGDGTNQS